jgi:hypothetical protein
MQERLYPLRFQHIPFAATVAVSVQVKQVWSGKGPQGGFYEWHKIPIESRCRH